MTWPTFTGGPGYAAKVAEYPSPWLVGPVSAVLAVQSGDDILDAVLTELSYAQVLDGEALVDMLARLVENVATNRLQHDRTTS